MTYGVWVASRAIRLHDKVILCCSEAAFSSEWIRGLIARLLDAAGIEPGVQAPEGVEVSVREGQGRKLLFIMNHTEQPQTVTVPEGKRELLTDKETGTTIELGIFDVAVILL